MAHHVAYRLHEHQLDRAGEPVIDHVERVAAGVPPRARGLAYLHDVLEQVDGADDELRKLGLSDDELSILGLLTRSPDEPYSAYVSRIARSNGRVGRIARVIKMADLDDHLRQRPVRPGAPDYAWAQEQIIASQRAHGEAPPASRAQREIRRADVQAATEGRLRRTG